MQFVDVLDPHFIDTACSIILCLVVRIFMPEKKLRSKKVLPFGTMGSGNYVSLCSNANNSHSCCL